MKWTSFAIIGFLMICCVNAFTVPVTSSSVQSKSQRDSRAASIQSQYSDVMPSGNDVEPPPLRSKPPRNICLMVEPTPFTHVSGYANRFKEMLKFFRKAGDSVDVLTVDAKTPAKELPKHFMGYPIEHTLGFTFPLYNQISLTCDLPEAKGAIIIERRKPDLIHVTSP